MSRGSFAVAARRWLANRTLGGRLIAGLVMLLAIACAVVGGATYLGLRGFLVGQLDQQLQAAAHRYAVACQHYGLADAPPPSSASGDGHPDGPDCGTINGQAAGTLGARIEQGVVTSASLVRGHCHLSAAEQSALVRVPADGHPRTMSIPSLHGDYRVVAYHDNDHDVLISGLPLAGPEATLHDVEVTELVIFAVVLVLAGAGGTALVRTSLRPLRRVAATATRVTELPLADGRTTLPERVPDTSPQTEVGQVGTAFNRMLGHVESALARRAASEARLRRFAADASHELRTPLAAIRGYSELARRHPGPVPEEIAHALARVEAESARMSLLVDELLLLARLDAGRPLASEPVDLTRLAIVATSDAQAAGPDHKWVLELPGEPVLVRGDEHRLHQVLANLLSNARAHTPAGTTVTIRLAPRAGEPAKKHAQAGVRLSVTDNGPGIPDGLQPDLFDRFVHGRNPRSPDSGGTGLGLAIVDAVVKAHGGSVAVSSRPGLTEFAIVLPPLAGAARGGRSGRGTPPA